MTFPKKSEKSELAQMSQVAAVRDSVVKNRTLARNSERHDERTTTTTLINTTTVTPLSHPWLPTSSF
jgi:hypothetical protein